MSSSVQFIDRFMVLGRISSGAMGEVYHARESPLGRAVALKLIRSDLKGSSKAVDRFLVEAQAAARLSHPNIVSVYAFGVSKEQEGQEGRRYLAMQLIEGANLAEILKGKRIKEEEAVVHLIALAWAVQHAHENQVIHRDIKPSNVLVDESNKVYLSDFGLAKALDSGGDLTKEGVAIGTIRYMAPEQARGDANLTTAVDIWSLGLLLVECITGLKPWPDIEDEALILKQLFDGVTIPYSSNQFPADRNLRVICQRCLSLDPSKRYRSAAALAEDLQRWRNHEPIEARPVGLYERVTLWCRRRPLLAGVSLSMVLAILLWSVREYNFTAQRILNGKIQQIKLVESILRDGRTDEAFGLMSELMISFPGDKLIYQTAARSILGRNWLRIASKPVQPALSAIQHEIDTEDEILYSLKGRRSSTEPGVLTGTRIGIGLRLFECALPDAFVLARSKGGKYLEVLDPDRFQPTRHPKSIVELEYDKNGKLEFNELLVDVVDEVVVSDDNALFCAYPMGAHSESEVIGIRIRKIHSSSGSPDWSADMPTNWASVKKLSISPDGRYLAVLSDSLELIVLDSKSGHRFRHILAPVEIDRTAIQLANAVDQAPQISFSGDSSIIVIGWSNYSTVWVSRLSAVDYANGFLKFSSGVRALNSDVNSRSIFCGFGDGSVAAIEDGSDRPIAQRFGKATEGAVTILARNRGFLLVGGINGDVSVLSSESGLRMSESARHKDFVVSLITLPDRFIVGSADGWVTSWQYPEDRSQKGKLLYRFTGKKSEESRHVNEIVSGDFENGISFAAGSEGGDVMVARNGPSNQVVYSTYGNDEFGSERPIQNISIDRKRAQFIVTRNSGAPILISARPPYDVHRLSGPHNSAWQGALVRDCDQLLSDTSGSEQGNEGARLSLWDIKSDRSAGHLIPEGLLYDKHTTVQWFSVSKDGWSVAAIINYTNVFFWDLHLGNTSVGQWSGSFQLFSCSVSESGEWVGFGGVNAPLCLWNPKSKVAVESNQTRSIYSVLVDDNANLFAGAEDGTLLRLDRSGRLVRIGALSNRINYIDSDLNHTRIVAGSSSGEVAIWSYNNNVQELDTFRFPGSVNRVTFVDGRNQVLVACNDGGVYYIPSIESGLEPELVVRWIGIIGSRAIEKYGELDQWLEKVASSKLGDLSLQHAR